MWKKTALKRLFKLLPKTNFSDQLIAAISHDYETEMEDVSKPKTDKYADLFEEIPEAEVVKDNPPAPKQSKRSKEPEQTKEIFNQDQQQ